MDFDAKGDHEQGPFEEVGTRSAESAGEISSGRVWRERPAQSAAASEEVVRRTVRPQKGRLMWVDVWVIGYSIG